MTARSLAILAPLALFGCNAFKTETQKQVYEAARPRADALRKKLVAAGNLVAASPPVAPGSTCAAPRKLTFDPSSDAHDTDFLMVQEARRGGAAETADLKDEMLNLHFATNPLARVMRGTAGFYADYLLGGTADEALKQTVERGLRVKNVVLVRERSGALDYFLVDLAPEAPAVVCSGSFTPTADPTLAGAHTKEYLVLTINKRTGKEVKRETRSVTTDPAKSALYEDAIAQLALRMNKELGLSGIE